jgi:hypothetical protein
MWKDMGLVEWFFNFENQGDIKREVPTMLVKQKIKRL